MQNIFIDSLFIVLFFVVGACFGSFACAYAWRLRARQLKEDKDSNEAYSKKEYEKLKPLLGKKASQDRSICLSCKKQLCWFDLIPIYSWLVNRGACRHCKKPIGLAELISEVGLGLAWTLTYCFIFPQTVTLVSAIGFVIILISLILLTILFIYDQKWMLLPNQIIFPLIALGCVFSTNAFLASSDKWLFAQSLGLGVLILSGLYWVLFVVSSGKLIGFGDIKLGLALALLLADWRLAFLALFLGNLIGCLLIIPMAIKKRVNKETRIPFGPLLILGFIFSLWFGKDIINLYFNLFFV